MSNRTYPYSADELRGIADKIDEVISALGGDELPAGDWRWGVTVDIYHEGGLVGRIKAHGDSWLGFYPQAVSE